MAPLRFDSDFREEIEKALRPVLAQNRLHWWVATLGLVLVLVGVAWWLRAVGVPLESQSVALISVSAVWLTGVISAGQNALVAAITLNMCAVEWVGRKQLGEYEDPGRRR